MSQYQPVVQETRLPYKSLGGLRNAFLTLRIPEKTKYGLMLMSRLHHEPVADIVIRALNNLFSAGRVGLIIKVPGDKDPMHLLDAVWAERESDRVANLAMTYPQLLSASEKLAWDAISEDTRYWETTIQGSELKRELLAQEWSYIKERIAPDAPRSGFSWIRRS